MEILIKAKQGDNPQFQFLNKDSPLHPYYSALIALIKAGKWPEKKVDSVEGESCFLITYYKTNQSINKYIFENCLALGNFRICIYLIIDLFLALICFFVQIEFTPKPLN